MLLSKLESDLIGDMACDGYYSWEIYQFVRHHYPLASEDEVLKIGYGLLDSWVGKGWLEAYQELENTRKISGEEILAFVRQAKDFASDPEKPTIRIELTDRAFEDIKWLQRLS